MKKVISCGISIVLLNLCANAVSSSNEWLSFYGITLGEKFDGVKKSSSVDAGKKLYVIEHPTLSRIYDKVSIKVSDDERVLSVECEKTCSDEAKVDSEMKAMLAPFEKKFGMKAENPGRGIDYQLSISRKSEPGKTFTILAYRAEANKRKYYVVADLEVDSGAPLFIKSSDGTIQSFRGVVMGKFVSQGDVQNLVDIGMGNTVKLFPMSKKEDTFDFAMEGAMVSLKKQTCGYFAIKTFANYEAAKKFVDLLKGSCETKYGAKFEKEKDDAYSYIAGFGKLVDGCPTQILRVQVTGDGKAFGSMVQFNDMRYFPWKELKKDIEAL